MPFVQGRVGQPVLAVDPIVAVRPPVDFLEDVAVLVRNDLARLGPHLVRTLKPQNAVVGGTQRPVALSVIRFRDVMPISVNGNGPDSFGLPTSHSISSSDRLPSSAGSGPPRSLLCTFSIFSSAKRLGPSSRSRRSVKVAELRRNGARKQFPADDQPFRTGGARPTPAGSSSLANSPSFRRFESLPSSGGIDPDRAVDAEPHHPQAGQIAQLRRDLPGQAAAPEREINY